MKTVKDYIRTIPDFPHEGIMFRDVTALFGDARGFRMAIDQLLHPYAGTPIDKVVGLEARGFILGGAIAHQLSVGFVPIRKKGKLPGTVISEEYKLEYGEAIVEIHDDAIQPGEKILVVDDLLATGGTAAAGATSDASAAGAGGAAAPSAQVHDQAPSSERLSTHISLNSVAPLASSVSPPDKTSVPFSIPPVTAASRRAVGASPETVVCSHVHSLAPSGAVSTATLPWSSPPT